MEDSLPPLDLSSALTLLGDAVSRVVVQALEGTGLRHGHGYLVQRLLVAPATATELANDLGITQQAVSKTIKELLDLGHLETVPNSADRRRRPVRLTSRGIQAVERARAARAEVESQLHAALGQERMDRAMADLQTMLSVLGLSDDVRRRKVRPPGPEL
jgi:DNA-binding MarR family transcriptional regulator